MSYILAADVGGTKTNIGIFDSEHGCRNPVVEETLLCKNYSSFNELLKDFLAGKEYPVESACFGVAGPVREGSVQLTNLPWLLEEEELKQVLGINSVFLINDLVALGHAIPELTEEDVVTLHEGKPEKHGTIGIVAPGTGLGMAFLVWDGAKYIVCPSEGGHASFSPHSNVTLELLEYMMAKGNPVSLESLCSGRGIPYIYSFLKEKKEFAVPNWLKIHLDKAFDQTPVIVDAALDKDLVNPLCKTTLKVFVEILADVCRNFALTVIATGGIYLGGGIPPRINKFLQQSNFVGNFQKSENFKKIILPIPLNIIFSPKSSLVGCASFAFKFYNEHSKP